WYGPGGADHFQNVACLLAGTLQSHGCHRRGCSTSILFQHAKRLIVGCFGLEASRCETLRRSCAPQWDVSALTRRTVGGSSVHASHCRRLRRSSVAPLETPAFTLRTVGGSGAQASHRWRLQRSRSALSEAPAFTRRSVRSSGVSRVAQRCAWACSAPTSGSFGWSRAAHPVGRLTSKMWQLVQLRVYIFWTTPMRLAGLHLAPAHRAASYQRASGLRRLLGGRRAGRGVYRRGAAAGRHPRSGKEPYRCHLEFRRNSDMMKLSCQIVGKIADTFRGEASRRVRAPWKSETQGGSCGCEAR